MSDRIKELLNESSTITSHETWNDDGFRRVYNTVSTDYVKFAELIIKECHHVIKSDMELKHIQMVTIDFQMYANNDLERVIKEHFEELNNDLRPSEATRRAIVKAAAEIGKEMK